MRKMRKVIRRTLFFGILIYIIVRCTPVIFHKNSGASISYGTPGNGKIKNAWKIDYSSPNSRYFSPFSYYILGNCFLNSNVYKTVKQAYNECEQTCKGVDFVFMECSDKDGGKQLIHRTHQNGLSVDFMIPKKRKGKQFKLYDYLGVWHYLLNFDQNGKLNYHNNIYIDFESMGKHIIALDNAARKNGFRIQKVILKINLKDDLFKTPTGKLLKKRGFYFARYLVLVVDKLHDDHYHVDFVQQK